MTLGNIFSFTRPAPAALRLPALLLVLTCFLPLSPLLAQQLTLQDQAEIKYQAQLTLMEYESILNLISNAAVPASAVHDAINSAYHEPSTRIFYAHNVPVDNTIAPSALADLEQPPLRALDFIREFASQYVKSELETVDFYNFQLSDLQQAAYPYISIKYRAHFKGRHKTDPALYPPLEQVAQLRAEKKADRWVTYIISVTRYQAGTPFPPREDKATLAAQPADDGTYANRLAELLGPENSRQSRETDAAIAWSWQAFDAKRFAELRQQAEQAEQQRAYASARTLYQQALQLKPDNAPTQARLRKLEQTLAFNEGLEAKFKEGAYLEAIQAYGKAISDDPKNADLYFGRARAYEKLKDFGAALDNFNTAIKLDPQFAEAYNQRAKLYERTQQPQKALADYNQIIQHLPNGAAYYPERASLKQAMGDRKGSIADYEAAIKQAPDKATLHYQKGLLLQEQQVPEEAIAAFSKALSLDSLLAPAHYARGLAYMEQQNISAAAVDFEQARAAGLSARQLAEIDKLAREHHQAGEQALAKGDARLALQHIIKAVLIAPTNEQAWVLKGDAHFQLKDYDNALQSYTRAIDLERPSLAYYQRGMVLRERKEFAAAKSDFARFIPIGAELVAAAEGKATTAQSAQSLEQVAQEVAEGWYRLGNAQLLAEQYKEAQASLDKAMAINKTYAQALFAQGAVQLGLKDYKRAIRDIEKSLKWGIEDSPWVYLALGDAYQALGQTEYAISIYTYILEKVDKDFEPAYLQRSDSYKQLKQYPQALQDITKALSLNEAFSRDVGLLTRKGLLELHESRYQEAGQTFDRALQLENTNAWALYGKASVLASQNKLDESLKLYRQAFQTGQIEWSAIKDDPIIRQVSKQKAFQDLVDASFRL